MKYDDASWHSGGDFPDDLPPSAGATHIGLYLAWAVLAGLGSEEVFKDFSEEIKLIKSRKATPASVVLSMDGKMTEDEFSEEGNGFTQGYYEDSFGVLFAQYFLDDYGVLSSKDQSSFYYIADSWDNFDILKPILDQRLSEWRSLKKG